MAEPLTLYKLIILYMLQKVDFPLSNAQISGFILDKGYTNYFHLQQAISELIESGLVRSETVRNASYLKITESGNQTLEYFGTEVSEDIKKDIGEFFRENSMELKEERSAIADYYKSDKEGYLVRCQAKERDIPLIDMTLTVPTKEAAEALCAAWKNKSKQVYESLLDMLL